MRRARLVVLSTCVFGLSACGGSSGSGAPNDEDGSVDAVADGSTFDDARDAATSDSDATSDASTTDGDSGSSASFPVYPGCASPASTFARTIYVDPAAGSDGGDGSKTSPLHTLTSALAKKKINPGDHVVLLPGDHGAVTVSKSSNPELAAATTWLWLDFQSGATVQLLAIGDMANWLVTRAEVTADATVAKSALVAITSSTNVVVADSHLYTVKDASGWTADAWINTAANGFLVRNGSCLALVRNKVLNSRFGIAVTSDALARPATSMQTLVQGNEVANFSGDAMRVIASDVIVKGNYVHDVYVSAADGDSNHDDGLQMWALGGATFDNIRIEGNWVQETTDATRPLQNELQGIDDFDGVNTHVVITNNVVLASAYHGVALYGAQDSTIDHNTVANPTSNGHQLWVAVADEKDGTPSKNITATDNAATTFDFSTKTVGFVNTNNVAVADPTSVYTTFDTTKMIFDLTPKKGSSLDGVGAGSSQVKPPAGLP